MARPVACDTAWGRTVVEHSLLCWVNQPVYEEPAHRLGDASVVQVILRHSGELLP